MNTKSRKIIMLITSIAIVFVTLISILFIAKEADHDCAGQDCPICACIQSAEQSIKQLGNGLAEAIVSLMVPSVFLLLCLAVSYTIVSVSTPVSNKVKLNN